MSPEARIQPVQEPYSEDVATMLSKWMPPGAGVEPLRLFRTLAVHEGLAGRMRPLGAGILGSHALIEPPLREVAIARTCALTGAAYEWGVHAVAFGRPLGLTEEQLRSTVHGAPQDPCWDEREAAVMGLADELHHTSTIGEQLWERLGRLFDEAQILELIVTCGYYHVIAYVCNGAAVQPEEWAEPFPPRIPATC